MNINKILNANFASLLCLNSVALRCHYVSASVSHTFYIKNKYAIEIYLAHMCKLKKYYNIEPKQPPIFQQKNG